MAGHDVTLSGSGLSAGGTVTVAAGNDITLATVVDSRYVESDSKKSGGLMNSSKSHSESQEVTNQVSTISGGGAVSLSAGNDLTLQAAQVAAGRDLSLSAGGTLSLLSATDSSYLSTTSSKSSAVWQSSGQHGHSDTTVKMSELTSGGTVTLNAGKGIVADYKATGDLQTSLTALAKDPKTAWVAQLATRDAVTWNAVREAHQKWDHDAQGLSAAASIIIAIVVAVATGGAGAGLAGVAGDTVLGAAADAGFSALVSQASISLINNQGDLGKTMQQLGSLDTVKNLAISMASAGAFEAVGTATDFHGVTLDKALDNPTNYAANVAGHAAVACAMGAASGGKCGSGAAAEAVSAAATPVYSSTDLAAGTALSAGIGGATAKLTGGNAAQGALTGAFGYLYNDALVMEDPKGALNAGHMAVAIGDDKSGWDYYSKDGPESFTDGNQHQFYSSKQDLLNAQPRYSELLRITTSPPQDSLMRLYANANYTTSYNFCTNNCSDLVVRTLQAGGITIPKNITTFGVTTPVKVFDGLKTQQQ